MSDTVIQVENLWKQYRLGTINHGTLKADMASWWARMRGKDDPNLRVDYVAKDGGGPGEPDRFWALKDINFEVKQGEVLGIIGKNGAGKSTLLKILSRVTTPTRGQIKVKGRIASLLEVGTGFHPELTGRENIFLNGAILGMNKEEIRRKLDEIIAFAEIEKFIDTPVKRYSSGMYVRLAFAVAAHLEPEILVVDEVLAVGDAEFQKKCLGKMGDVARHGRTVLFVSHNMSAVRRLCTQCIVMANGTSSGLLPTPKALTHYLSNLTADKGGLWSDPALYKNSYFTPTRLEYLKEGVVEVEGVLHKNTSNLAIALVFLSSVGEVVFWTTHRDSISSTKTLPLGSLFKFQVELPRYVMNDGQYTVDLAVFLHNVEFIIEQGKGPRITFDIHRDFNKTGLFDEGRDGMIAPILTWSVKEDNSELAKALN